MFGSYSEPHGFKRNSRKRDGEKGFVFVLSRHTALLKTLVLWYIKLFFPRLGFSFLILHLDYSEEWFMFQMWTVSAYSTAKEVQVLDSPLWTINSCILKVLSFWKKKNLPIFISRDKYGRKINSQRTRELQGLWLLEKICIYESCWQNIQSFS